MDRRPGRAPAVTLVTLLLGGPVPAKASLLIDFDTARVLWRNDDSPAIEGRRGGQTRQLGSDALYAAPLAAGGELRFPPCRSLPEAARDDCPDTLLPAGAPRLEREMPLSPALREAYLPLWQLAEPPMPPEEEELAEAMKQLRGQLTTAIHLRDLPRLVEPLQRAALQAETAAVAPGLTAQARRSERMMEVLAELWRIRNDLSSRDLSFPCDTLERKMMLFNEAAGEPAVRLHRQRPPGICLFCGNVCTPASADRLLADMKRAVIRSLGEDGLSGSEPGS